MENNNLISVIIPVYNRESTVERSIKSVLNQTISNIEVIVVDDLSTDRTCDIVSHIKDERVKLIKLKKKGGAQVARNRGILKAQGKWIAFLDSDDELLCDSLEVRLAALNSSGFSDALVYGDVLLDDNKVVKFKKLYGYAYEYLLKELSLCPYSVMMMTKYCIERSGFPSDNFPSWQDDDMVLTIGKFFPLIHCGQHVAKFYRSPNSITKDKKKVYLGCKMIVEKYKEDILKYHGRIRLFLWRLRILRSWIIATYSEKKEKKSIIFNIIDAFYSVFLQLTSAFLTRLLSMFFDNIYA